MPTVNNFWPDAAVAVETAPGLAPVIGTVPAIAGGVLPMVRVMELANGAATGPGMVQGIAVTGPGILREIAVMGPEMIGGAAEPD